MNALDWLNGHRVQRLERRDYDWVLTFDGNAVLVISCLWRLLERHRIQMTSEDHGQQFGLPTAVDAAAEASRRLQSLAVQKVRLNAETLDLELELSDGVVFQLLPDSSGYEAWIATNENTEFIATGGGRLSAVPAQRR